MSLRFFHTANMSSASPNDPGFTTAYSGPPIIDDAPNDETMDQDFLVDDAAAEAQSATEDEAGDSAQTVKEAATVKVPIPPRPVHCTAVPGMHLHRYPVTTSLI